MNNKQEFLTEDRYHNTKNKIKMIACTVLCLGVLVGITVIGTGYYRANKNNSKYTEEAREQQIDKLNNKLAEETDLLETRKKELENEGARYNVFAEYTEKNDYEYTLIVDVLKPGTNECRFDEALENNTVGNFCKLKNQLREVKERNLESAKSMNEPSAIPFYMIGGFIIVSSLMIGGSIYMASKGREILAYNVQQTMPVMQEGLEKMTPTVTKIGKQVLKEMTPAMKDATKEMSSAYGEVAKEISKGIKEGINEANKKDE